MKKKKQVYGGIEGGGTKFVCAVGTGPYDIHAEVRFPTTTPEETLEQAISFFRDHDGLSAIGVACFGPLDPRPDSVDFGKILPTPKPGWSGADIVGPLRSCFDLPIGFDTDVNGAALGERLWGAAQGLDTFMYLTIGTGIGGGACVNGRLVHGLLHPEMGHISVPHDLTRDPFEGICPFHRDCFEGLASGVAMERRWGQRAETLPSDHPAWELEAHYIAHALANYIYILSPQRIIVGGGVGQNGPLLKQVQKKTLEVLNGYVKSSTIVNDPAAYIVPPALGNRAGVAGAIALAQQAFLEEV